MFDLITVIVLLIVVLIVFRKFSSFVYAFAIIDLFLRILQYIKDYSNVAEIKSLIGRIFPANIPAIIGKYSSGILEMILMWVYIIIMSIFLGYIISYFIKKRK